MPEESRLYPVLQALSALGMDVEPALYADAVADEVREQLLGLDAVLVWADPRRGDADRVLLDRLLREVAAHGVLVSAHPDTILKMGTKEVLYRSRDLGWGSDTHLYATLAELEAQFPARLAEGRPRVLKQHRGNDGVGVWKVELLAGAPPGEELVRVQHAATRDDAAEELALSQFLGRCAGYFGAAGPIIDQAFAGRLAEGMIRAYLVGEEVVGFARQTMADPSLDPAAPAPERAFGIPSKKTMYGPSEPEFQALRERLEGDWVPGLERLVDVDREGLPLLWDCDFLYGPKTGSGEDTHMLCEINVSSVSPFPDTVPAKLATALRSRLAHEPRRRSATGPSG